MAGQVKNSLSIQARVTCPHCWHEYLPEESLWISQHPDLIGDARLGPEHAIRFLPSRFTADGEAIDPEGQRTTRLACPLCHLEVARPLYQIPPMFFSILGAPASGKSYYLTSMAWQMRQVLPSKFSVAMIDTDAELNARLHDYEEIQFLNPNPDELVAIAKTQVQGDLYDTVNMGTHTVQYPRPFLFNLQPLSNHPNYSKSRSVSKVMCLYDNAGESFLPGQDTTSSPVTRHLARSKCLFFLFDPTQDPRFRQACQGKSADPQMLPRASRLARENSVRQDTILLEAIQRVRRHAGLREDQLHQRPLVIVVTKWDSWEALLPGVSREDPFIYRDNLGNHALDGARIEATSQQLAKLLRTLTPEIVAAAEGFAAELIFIPVSATGRAPEVDEATGSLGVRPRDIAPYWVEVPMLYALSRWSPGLVATVGLSNPSARKPGS
jgi:hypothetical protein